MRPMPPTPPELPSTAPPERPELTLGARRTLAQIVRIILEDSGPDRPPPAAPALPARRTLKKAA